MAAAFAVDQLFVLSWKKLNDGLMCKGKYRVNTFTRFLRLIDPKLGPQRQFLLGKSSIEIQTPTKHVSSRNKCKVNYSVFTIYSFSFGLQCIVVFLPFISDGFRPAWEMDSPAFRVDDSLKINAD